MENSRFWIFLGLGVSAMLSMKYLATAPDADSYRWKNAFHTALDADDGSIDSRRLHAHGGGVPRPRPILAGLTNSMRHTTSASSVAPDAPAKTTKKVDPKKDDKKKKKDDKKKKTAKKADVNGGTMQAQQNPLPPASSGFGANAPSPSSGGGQAAQNAAAAAAAAAQAPSSTAGSATNPKNLSLHDWEDLLIVTPSYSETVLFIKDYQTKLVTADIFYAIIKEMMADKREVLNQYGVMALQATPSVTSLSMLIAITTTNATITTQVTTALNAYQALSYLGVLKTALTTTAATNMQKLLTLISQSATKNLTGTTGTTGGGETTQGGVAATTKAAYGSVLTELQSIESKATDATTQSEIASLITTLNGLGVTTTTTTGTAVAEANRGYYQSGSWH